MRWKQKEKKFIIEYSREDVKVSIPFQSSHSPELKLTTYEDLQISGLTSAKLLGNIEGNGTVSLWEETSNHQVSLKENKYIQNSPYTLYLSNCALYIVKMNGGDKNYE